MASPNPFPFPGNTLSAPRDVREDEGDGGQAARQAQVNDIFHEKDIFGGDSDLSDVSDDEDEGSPAPDTSASRVQARSRARSSSASGHSSEEEDVPSSDDDAGDDYKAAKEPKTATVAGGINSLKFKKTKKRKEDDVDGEREERAPAKKRKKTKKAKEQIEEDDEIDPDVARRRALEARLEALIKKPKKSGLSKKRGGVQDDDLEAMNDEAVVRLRNDMFTAADADIEENEAKRFAIHKLRMLPTVVETMQKATLAESLVENGLLEAVKRWLEPLPDHSLPAVNIQRPLFEILCTLSIETSALKSSGLGKIVYFYTKCKRVEPFIARMANQLVSDWMRPIIRRSKAFTDKDTDLVDDEDDYRDRRVAVMKPKPENDISRRHARIPEMLTTSFRIAPESDPKNRVGSGQTASHGTGVTTKMKSYKKKLIAGQAASRRV